MDMGDPISYLTLAGGTPVFASGGERVGVVEHVLAAEDVDVFDGLILDGRAGPGGWRFVDAEQIEAIHERGVTLALSESEVEALPEPSGNPATMSVDPDDTTPDDMGDKLKRAWSWLSGRY